MKKSVWSGGHTQPVLCLDHNEDGVLVSGGEDGIVSLWSSDGIPQAKFSVAFGDNCDVNCVCFCRKESKTLYVSCGTKIFMFDMRNFSTPIWQLEHNKDEISQITLNNKSSFLAAADDSGEIQIFELPSAKPFKTLSRRHTNICCCVQYRPQRPWEILSGGMDYNIFNWDFSSGRTLCHVNVQDLRKSCGNTTVSNYNVNPPFVNSIDVASDSRRFACGLGDGSIAMFKFEGKKKFCLVSNLQAHSQGVSQVHFPRFQADNSQLLSGGNDCKLVLWQFNNMTEDPRKSADSSGHSESQSMSVAHLENHGDKINWLCSTNLSRNIIFVADNTDKISLYELL